MSWQTDDIRCQDSFVPIVYVSFLYHAGSSDIERGPFTKIEENTSRPLGYSMSFDYLVYSEWLPAHKGAGPDMFGIWIRRESKREA